MATIGRQCDGRPDRHRCLLAALQALYLERAQQHGCALDEAAVTAVLAMDIELNAQGLACWLDRVRSLPWYCRESDARVAAVVLPVRGWPGPGGQ
ncbi:hypothetical protein G6F62_015385 [Rhizopus arrhizus]|nr:hypothetical protein G6F62_015385 [Rhizopus arrhizus]